MVDEKVEQLKRMAREELKLIDDMGGTLAAIENAYMKRALVESNAIRVAGIESGERIVVGVNKWTEAEESPLTAGEGIVLAVDPRAEIDQVAGLKAWRDARRRQGRGRPGLFEGGGQAERHGTVHPMRPRRRHHRGMGRGAPRNPRGIPGAHRRFRPSGRRRRNSGNRQPADPGGRGLGQARPQAQDACRQAGTDGHSKAEQIAVRARDAGIEVIYEGIRLTPEEICQAALEESVHVVGLSILSGSHIPLMEEFMFRMRDAGMADVPVVIGGIIPPEDERLLLEAGVTRVYTPKDFDLSAIVADNIEIVGGMPRRAA